jgi:pyrroloquinoline quinone biosynthesis protein D
MNQPLTKRTAAFSESAIDGEVVLLNLQDGTFFSLTGTAAVIWPLIDGSRNRTALLADVAATYATAPETIAADLDAFLAQLAEAGFLAEA